MVAYCLFCETQKCGVVARQIEQLYGCRCISPQIIQRKWVKGACLEERHNLLPGYVFLYAEEPLAAAFWLPGIIRWLGSGFLKGEDAAFAEMILEKDGVLGIVKVAEVGDRCVISDPHWEGMTGTITKIDRGRKRCCVEFTFDAVKWTVWLGYEMVKKAEGE